MELFIGGLSVAGIIFLVIIGLLVVNAVQQRGPREDSTAGAQTAGVGETARARGEDMASGSHDVEAPPER